MESGDDNKSACCEIVNKLPDDVKIEEKPGNDNKLNCTQMDAEKSTVASSKPEEVPAITTLISTEWMSNSDENMIQAQSETHQSNSPQPIDSFLKNKSGVSDSELISKKTSTSGLAKILQWDPWHKIRRNKKKDKHKKIPNQKAVIPDFIDKCEGANLNTFDMKPLEETVYEVVSLHTNATEYESMFNVTKDHKSQKNVRFQNNVTVVLFGNDKVIQETVEPLKKELEQQERNKELRKEACPEGYKPPNWKKTNDYMTAWYTRKK